MKPLLTTILVLSALCGFGQSNGLSISNTPLKSISDFQPTYKICYVGDWRIKYKPIDTVECLMYLYAKNKTVQGWHSGYVVLIDGGVFTDQVEWKKPYFHIAVGPFKNVFLAPNKKDVIKDDYVLQLTLVP